MNEIIFAVAWTVVVLCMFLIVVLSVFSILDGRERRRLDKMREETDRKRNLGFLDD